MYAEFVMTEKFESINPFQEDNKEGIATNVCVFTCNVPPSHQFPVHDHKSQIPTSIVEKAGLWALCNRSSLAQKHMFFLLPRTKLISY